MTNWTRLCGSSALFLLSISTPALADVTAQDVWDDWRGHFEGSGLQLQASESMSGDTLTISDLTMSMTDPEGEGSFSMSLDNVTFTENGDGTVTVSIPQSMPINASGTGEDGEEIAFVIDTTHTGFGMIVSGDADNHIYNYTAAEVGMALRDLTADGQKIETAKAMVNISNILGSTTNSQSGLREMSQKMAADSVTYDFSFVDPEEGGTGLIKGALSDLTFTGTTSLPQGVDNTDMAAMLAAGFALEGNYAYKDSSTEFSFVDGNEAVAGDSAAATSNFAVVMNAERLSLDGASTGTILNLAGGDLPIPLNLSIGDLGFNMAMPVAKSDDEQDFALGLNLGGLTVADMLWNMADPGAVLPRDPATLRFDIIGKVKLLADLMNPAEMEAVDRGEVTPGELNALSLNDFELSLAGASVTGAGDFTFDNTDLKTFDGMPRPAGALDLKLVGVNRLIDKLIQMGMLPQEQALGARMMMGVFATPGDGDDTLVSKIEVNDQGHILANGQRLQ